MFKNTDTFSKLKIDKEQYDKTVLWMPTFKVFKNRYNDLGKNSVLNEALLPLLNTYNDLNMINELLQRNNNFMAIKIHPGQDFRQIQYSNIRISTNSILEEFKVELYEFIKEFDSLLTNYSSVFLIFYYWTGQLDLL